jgi:hypothetical protein
MWFFLIAILPLVSANNHLFFEDRDSNQDLRQCKEEGLLSCTKVTLRVQHLFRADDSVEKFMSIFDSFLTDLQPLLHT